MKGKRGGYFGGRGRNVFNSAGLAAGGRGGRSHRSRHPRRENNFVQIEQEGQPNEQNSREAKLEDLSSFLLMLKKTPSHKTVSVLEKNYVDWKNCWKHSDSLATLSLSIMLIALAKVPYSSQLAPPQIEECERTVKRFLTPNRVRNQPKPMAEDVEIVLNVIKRLLQFEWSISRETVYDNISKMIQAALGALNVHNRDDLMITVKLHDLLVEIDKPWTIKLLSRTSMACSKLLSTAKWQTATVAWLTDPNKFVAVNLPQMKTGRKQGSTVYGSVQEYFDVVSPLWTALTFGEGFSALYPFCRFRDATGKECGQTLWPSTTRHVNLSCTSRQCHREADVACTRHPYGLCSYCCEKVSAAYRGSRGPYASSHVYDASVKKMKFDGTILLENVLSRRPPQVPIHWRTTRRLCSPNLVGIVLLATKDAALQPDDAILWGKIVFHQSGTQNWDEFRHREQGRVAITIFEINKEHVPLFQAGDSIALIDCQTFAPEYIPVLSALEIQQTTQLPFENGKLLNIHDYESDTYVDIDNFAAAMNQSTDFNDKESLEQVLENMIEKSTIDPIVQIRRNTQVRGELIRELCNLVRSATLDKGQMASFIQGLMHPVHCTQGPPGTGKSYLGVVMVRALVLIRRLFMKVAPAIGHPPILVLSYKNHAIDEFLLDFIRAQGSFRRLNLIRIGTGARDEEGILDQYSERHAVKNRNAVVQSQRNLELAHGIMSLLSDVASSGNKFELAKWRFQESSDGVKAIECFLELIGRVCYLSEKDLDSVANDDDDIFNFDSFADDLSNLLKQGVAPLVTNESLATLEAGVVHVASGMQVCDMLYRWLEGQKPPPQCVFIDENQKRCQFPSQEGVLYCSVHRCQSHIEGVRCLKMVTLGKPWCKAHACAESDCTEVRLPAPQQYCNAHCCIVCLERYRIAQLALDVPPRNTCREHPLCCAFDLRNYEQCIELSAKGDIYCEIHRSKDVQCSGTTKKGKQCKARVKSYFPYCEVHRFQATQESNASQSASASMSTRQLTPNNQKCAAVTSKKRNCKGSALPGMIYCSDHLEKYQFAPLQLEEQDVWQSCPNNRTEQVHKVPEKEKQALTDLEPELEGVKEEFVSEEGDGDHPSDDILGDISGDRCDLLEPQPVRDNDEFEVPEHLIHLHDVYELNAENASDKSDEEDAVIPEEMEVQEPSNWLHPSLWSWDMDVEKRWEALEQLARLDTFLLAKVEQSMQQRTALLRKRYHLERVKASSSVYENKEVIGGTIVGCITRLEAIRATKPFAIVIEEASEVMEPLLFACLGPTTTKLEMIGDHLQLQPSVMSKYEFEKLNHVNISMFERLIRSHNVPRNVLSVQRRMRANICDFTRDFYKDITCIEDHPICRTRCIPMSSQFKNCAGRGREIPGILPHVYFWCHEGAQTQAKTGLSRVNEREAMMVCSLVEYLVSCGVPNSSITVLTPYKGQLMLLKRELGKRSSKSLCNLSSVDRYQGSENDIVIISLVIDGKSRTSFVQLQNRMIVLLSRARLGMYLIGNKDYFQHNNGAMDHWKQTFDRLQLKATSDSPENAGAASYDGIRVGEELPICCPIHVDSLKLVQDPKELKLGFCEAICCARLPCTHECDMSCHWPNEHRSKCCVLVDSCCEVHPERLECHELTSTLIPISDAMKRYRCTIQVDSELPCGHETLLKCADEKDISAGIQPWPACKEPAFEPYIYPECKHQLNCSCIDLTKYKTGMSTPPPCTELCDYMPECGHAIEVACYAKQRYTRDPSKFKCKQLCTVSLPRCQHVVEIQCSRTSKLKDWTGITAKDGRIEHGKEYGPIDYHPCNKRVVFVKKCGHEIEMECSQAFKNANSNVCCKEIVKCRNPVCGHTLSVSCYERDELVSTCLEVMTPVEVIQEGNKSSYLVSEIPFGDLSKLLIHCEARIKFTKVCGHSIDMKCGEAFGILYEQRPNPDCRAEVTAQLKCGHEKKMHCNEHAKYQEGSFTVNCEKIVDKKCWNYGHCQEFVGGKCGNLKSVSCDKVTTWCCVEAKHEFKLQLCLEGIPTDCPRCSYERLEWSLREDATPQQQPGGGLPTELTPHRQILALEPSQELLDAYWQNKRKLMYHFRMFLDHGNCLEWERQLFEPHEFACFAIDEGQDQNSFSPQHYMKASTLNGIEVYEWNRKNLNTLLQQRGVEVKVKQSKSKEKRNKNLQQQQGTVSILFGYAFSCRMIIDPTDLQKGVRGQYNGWIKKQRFVNGFDAVKRDDGIILWEPFALLATHRICFSSKQLEHLLQRMSDIHPTNFKPRYIGYDRALPCGYRLSCGHQCPQLEHSDDPSHLKVICPKPCLRLHPNCSHPCPKPCSEPCGQCIVSVAAFELPCGHLYDENPLCFQLNEKQNVLCNQKVVYKLEACAHPCEAFCGQSKDTIKCRSRCNKSLPCGHDCTGECYRCQALDSQHKNVPCRSKCSRVLICGHECMMGCHPDTDCASCSGICHESCIHSKCSKPCSEPCSSCAEPCSYTCKHKGSCELPCGAPCNRLPCDERCMEVLCCGHQCVGVCGELICPPCYLCASAETKEQIVDLIMHTALGEIDPTTTRLIQLPACGHIFTTETLDGVMNIDEFYDLARQTLVPIRTNQFRSLKRCPYCNSLITQVYRYGRIINSAKMDLSTKKFISKGTREIQRLQNLLSAQFDLPNTPNELHTKLNYMSGIRRECDALMILVKHPPTLLVYEQAKVFGSTQQGSSFSSRNIGIEVPKPDWSMTLSCCMLIAHFNCRMAELIRHGLLSIRRRSNLKRYIDIQKESMQLLSNQVISRKDEHRNLRRVLDAQVLCLEITLDCMETGIYLFEFNQLQQFELDVYQQDKFMISIGDGDYPEKMRREKLVIQSRFNTLFDQMDQSRPEIFNKCEQLKDKLQRLTRTGTFYEPVTSREKIEIVKALGLSTGHYYRCPNGHSYVIADCGMAMETSQCPECNERIGGQNHTLDVTNTRDIDLETYVR